MPSTRTTIPPPQSPFLLLPEPERAAARRNVERLGRTVIDSLHALEERNAFVSSALMADVFTLGLETPEANWRVRALGLTLRDPTHATWVVSGSDPSLVVFGEIASGSSVAATETAHRLLAFYMYPERDESQPPIVVVDPGSFEVTWVAKDFDAFFWSLLHDAQKTQPTTVDTLLELLGRDSSSRVRPAIVPLAGGPPPPPWFALAHGRGNATPTLDALADAQAAMDLLLQERLLVAILATTRRCDVQGIGRELCKVYEALKWPDHIRAVRRWATAAPR